MKKKVLMLLALAGTLLLFASCGKKEEADKGTDSTAKTDWAAIEAKGELVVGVDDTFIPMGFKDDSGKVVGFDIDLAEAVAKELGVKAKIQPVDWKMKETELNNGTIDVIWNGYTVTAERAEKVAFTNAYLKNEQVIVTLAADKIASYDDLAGKVLGAQEDSSGFYALEEKPEILLDLIQDKAPVTYSSFSEAFMDLDAGRIQGLIVDSVYAEHYIAHSKNPADYGILPSQFEEEDYAIGVRKTDTETLAKLNEALKKAYDNGTTAEVSDKWFGEDKVIPQ